MMNDRRAGPHRNIHVAYWGRDASRGNNEFARYAILTIAACALHYMLRINRRGRRNGRCPGAMSVARISIAVAETPGSASASIIARL